MIDKYPPTPAEVQIAECGVNTHETPYDTHTVMLLMQAQAKHVTEQIAKDMAGKTWRHSLLSKLYLWLLTSTQNRMHK